MYLGLVLLLLHLISSLFAQNRKHIYFGCCAFLQNALSAYGMPDLCPKQVKECSFYSLAGASDLCHLVSSDDREDRAEPLFFFWCTDVARNLGDMRFYLYWLIIFRILCALVLARSFLYYSFPVFSSF